MIQNLDMSNPLIQILSLLVGITLLIAGRRLFWVTVSLAGFIIGLLLAFNFLQDQVIWLVLIIAVVAGVIGAVLAVFLQKAAVGLVGVIMGGYLLISLLLSLGFDLGNWRWLVFIIGAILGFILMVAVFEVGLVILSALFGAALIVEALNLQEGPATLVFILLAGAGILIQLRSRTPPATSPPPRQPPASRRS